MKIALNIENLSSHDPVTVAALAREHGCAGIDLFARADGRDCGSPDDSIKALRTVSGIVQRAGLEVACLSSPIMRTGQRRRDDMQFDLLRALLDAARLMDCKIVKIHDTQSIRGESRAAAGIALGNWLGPAGDHALGLGIDLVVENTPTFSQAGEMWPMLDRLDHPAIHCAWDVLSAALAGETPSVSVPVLNSRIHYATVRDARIGPEGVVPCRIGDGDAGVHTFIDRLRGIGYAGYIAASLPGEAVTDAASLDAEIRQAVARVKAWSLQTPHKVIKAAY